MSDSGQRLSDLLAIPRNDIAACERFVAKHGVTAKEVHIMCHLQDRSAELVRVSRNWNIKP